MNILKRMTLFFVIIFLVSCGGSGGGAAKPDSGPKYVGEWLSTCQIYRDELLNETKVTQSFLITDTEMYSVAKTYPITSDCSGNPGAEENFRLTYSLTGTVSTTSGDIADKVDMQVFERNGNPFVENMYWIMLIEQNNLYIADGGADPSLDGSTPATRFNTIDFSTTFAKQ